MRVTQKDIARSLNLSQSTIAKVLNDRPDVWVSDETRRRIHVAAAEAGYRPNAAARALSTGKTNSVALVFQRPAHNDYRIGFAEVTEVLAEFLGEHGYELSVKVLPDREQVLSRLDDLARSRACDAVVLWDDEVSIEEQALTLEELSVPFLVKGRFETVHPDWPQVDFDHEQMMIRVVRHLADRGHRRIALMRHDNELAYSRYFDAGFHQGMADILGAAPDPQLVRRVGAGRVNASTQILEWMRLPESVRPTAVVMAAGRTAWEGIEQGLASIGRKIGDGPGDIAVAGQGRHSLPLTFGHGYAYVGIDYFALAKAMADKLLWPLLNDKLPEGSRVIRVLPELQPTDSLNMSDYITFRST